MKRKFEPSFSVDKKIDTLDDGTKSCPLDEYNTWWDEAKKVIDHKQRHLLSTYLPYVSKTVESDPKLEAKRIAGLIFNSIPNPGKQTYPLQGKRKGLYDIEGDEEIDDVIGKYGSLIPGGCKWEEMEIPYDAIWKYPFTVEEYSWMHTTRNTLPRLWCFKRFGAATLCLCSCGQWIVTPSLSHIFIVACPRCNHNGFGIWDSIPDRRDSQEFFHVERVDPAFKKRKIEQILKTPFGQRSVFCFYAYIKIKTYFFFFGRSYWRTLKIFDHLSRFEGSIWFDIFLNPETEHVNVVDYLMLALFLEDVEDMSLHRQWSDLLDELSFWTGASLKYEIWKKKEKYILNKK